MTKRDGTMTDGIPLGPSSAHYILQYDPDEDRFEFINPITDQSCAWHTVPPKQLVFAASLVLAFRLSALLCRAWSHVVSQR
jgi:hypothetical protein